MDIEKQINEFISKWSTWFLFQKDADLLKTAFERELRIILESYKLNEKEATNE